MQLYPHYILHFVFIALGVDKNMLLFTCVLTSVWRNEKKQKKGREQKLPSVYQSTLLTYDRVATFEIILSLLFSIATASSCLLIRPQLSLPNSCLSCCQRHFPNSPYHLSPLLNSILGFPHIFRIKCLKFSQALKRQSKTTHQPEGLSGCQVDTGPTAGQSSTPTPKECQQKSESGGTRTPPQQ